MFVLSHIFLLLREVTLFHVLETVQINSSHEICKEPQLQNVCVFPCVFLITRIHFSKFTELHGFLFHAKYIRNPYLRNICVFPYFSRTMGIHFSNVLEILWIFASHKIFKELIIFQSLCFPILFPYYENSPLYYFGNYMNLDFSVFPYFFRTIGIHFPCVLGTILLM